MAGLAVELPVRSVPAVELAPFSVPAFSVAAFSVPAFSLAAFSVAAFSVAPLGGRAGVLGMAVVDVEVSPTGAGRARPAVALGSNRSPTTVPRVTIGSKPFSGYAGKSSAARPAPTEEAITASSVSWSRLPPRSQAIAFSQARESAAVQSSGV